MEQRLKTMPLFSGMMTDEKIEYNVENVQGDIVSVINDKLENQYGENQLAYIGGGFVPYEIIKKFGKKAYEWGRDNLKPIVKEVVDTSRDIMKMTEGNPKYETVNHMAQTVDKFGRVIGMGGRYSNI